MNITNPQLEASQGANGLWTFLVTAFLEYTREEVDSEFERWASVFEADAIGKDDPIIESAALRFRPPSGGHPAQWKFQNISRDLIDTELGDEEIYVQISLRNFTTDSFPITARTPTITISA